MPEQQTLGTMFTDIAEAIRAKNGALTTQYPNQMASAILAIPTGGGTPTLQAKSATPSESQQTITADSGYDGLSSVTVGAVSSTYVGSGVTRQAAKTVTPSSSSQQAVASGVQTTGAVTVAAVPSETKEITTNGTHTPSTGKWFSSVTVAVPTGGTINNQNKSVTPTESQQSVTADTGQTGLGTVTVGAISSTQVGSEISRKDSDDLTASGATVTAPAGQYAEAASTSVATGTAGTPTATKGTVSNHAISVTPSVTNTTGQITGGTKTGTAVSVSASELVSGTLTISSSGTKDVTNYASASVAAGSATAPASISGTAASVSTGTNTLTLSKTISVTPSVSAGYVSSGTAGNSSVSLTASVTTKAAATYYPSTTDQTVAASQYLTGAQTIKAVTVSGLSAANIVSGVTVTVGDSADADRITSVTGSIVINKYYTGSSNPSSSLGSNGDLYLKVVS